MRVRDMKYTITTYQYPTSHKNMRKLLRFDTIEDKKFTKRIKREKQRFGIK